jgi:transposase
MRLRGSAEVLEERRRLALSLLDEGRSLSEVGRQIGCSASSVKRWRDARREGGRKALKVRSSPGRPPKLTRADGKKLVAILLAGAEASGYATQLWTTARIAEVIWKRFHVRYHRDHVGRLLHALGWSHQRPQKRALERDPKQIARFVREDWPALKKTPRGWLPTSSLSTNRAFS